MGYTLVKSFGRGIDTRLLPDTAEPGSLLDARDCHITLGGQIEKRAAFVTVATLPDTTVGLYVTEGRVFHTWGDSTTTPSGMPPGAIYHPIPDPDGSPLTFILSVEEFNGGLFTIAKYEDGDVLSWWYNGASGATDVLLTNPPPPPDSGGTGGTPPDTTPGDKPRVSFELQLLGGLSSPDVTIDYIYLIAPASTYTFGTDAFMLIPTDSIVGGFPHCSSEVVTAPLQPEEVIARITNLINTVVTTPVDVTAKFIAPATVQFWIEVPGPAYNNWKIQLSATNCRWNPSNSEPTSGGADPPTSGSLRSLPGPAVLSGVVGAPTNVGTFVIAHNLRLWAVNDVFLNFTEEKDALVWESKAGEVDPLTGKPIDNFIDMSMITPRKPHLISLAEYRSDLALFGFRHIICYHMDFTLSQSFKRFALQGTGTFAPHSVTAFGEGEVMYLDVSGIRSLRARDSTDMGFSADIGNMIDDLVKQHVATSTADDKYHRYWGCVEPRSQRLWMALHDKIFVLSYYPSSRIAAWSYYDATTAPVEMMNASDDSMYWRAGDNVICYGDIDGQTYDDTEALVRLPYIDAGKPASSKNWSALDCAIYGTWAIRGSFDPNAPTALDLLATCTKSTYSQQMIAVNGESPGLSLELRSSFVGPARIGNAAVHFTDSTAD